MLCTIGLYIVKVQWSRTGDRFFIIFMFGMLFLVLRKILPQITRTEKVCCSKLSTDTYMSVVVHEVVGEFKFIEGDDLFHPLRSFSWGIWMHVNSARHLENKVILLIMVQEILFYSHHLKNTSWIKVNRSIDHGTRNATVVVNRLCNLSGYFIIFCFRKPHRSFVCI